MIRLKRLELENFRSFYGSTVVDFPEKGLLLIRGASLDHGDSSGSGKSSLLLAISYALGICPLPATALTSWGAEGPMRVSLVLQIGEAEAIITRGSKGQNVNLDNGTLITGAEGMKTWLRETLGLVPDVLAAITYRVQGTRGVFLSMTDADKKEFLSGLLSLGVIENAIEQAEEKLTLLEAALKDRQELIKNRADKLEWLRAQVAPPEVVAAVDTDRLRKLENEYEDFKRNKFLVAPEPSEQLRKLEKGLEVIKGKMATLRQAAAVDQGKLEQQQRDARNIQAQKRELKTLQKQRRQVELGLQQTKCPTCEQVWENAEKLRSVQAEIRSSQTLLDSLPDDGVLDSIITQRYTPNPEVAEWEDLRRTKELEHASIRSKEMAEHVGAQAMHSQRGASVERELRALQSQLTAENVARATRADWFHKRDQECLALEAKQSEAGNMLAKTLKDTNAERDFLALMGRKGFLGIIFDDVLAEIKEEVNTQLGKLANVSQVTLDFVSESFTKAGTTKKVITPVFYVNGYETRLEMLSGGMQTSVELVVDLALMTVVQRRTGTLPGWLMLDEAFNGQGTITKEAALEALRTYAEEKLIVVVDHSSETKEFFSQVIEVENSGGRSSVTALESP